MPLLKYDMSDVDRTEKEFYDGPEPAKGTYDAKIVEVGPHTKEGADKATSLKVVTEVTAGKYKGYRWYDYIGTEDPSEFAKRRLDELLRAMGVDTQKKAKGQVNTDTWKNKKLRVRSYQRTENYNGEDRLRSNVGGYLKAGSDASADAEEEEPTVQEEKIADEEIFEEPEEGTEAEGTSWATVGADVDIDENNAEAYQAIWDAAAAAELDPNEYDTWEALGEALDALDSGEAEEEAGDAGWTALGEQADGGDAEAEGPLVEKAEELGLDPQEYDTWAELAEAIINLEG